MSKEIILSAKIESDLRFQSIGSSFLDYEYNKGLTHFCLPSSNVSETQTVRGGRGGKAEMNEEGKEGRGKARERDQLAHVKTALRS